MMEAVSYLNEAPIRSDVLKTDEFIPLMVSPTLTYPLFITPAEGETEVVGTADIDEVDVEVMDDDGVCVIVIVEVMDAVILAVTDAVAVFEEVQEGDTDGFDPYPTCNEHVTTPLRAADTPT
jgi:hypothetical protein